MTNRIPQLFTISSIFLTRIEYQWRRFHADWEGRVTNGKLSSSR